MAYGAQLNVAIDTQAAIAILGDVEDSITATGASQTTAYQLKAAINIVRTTASGTGVKLPGTATPLPAGKGDRVTVANLGASSLNIYPPSMGTIQGGAINAAIILVALAAVSMRSIDGNNWIAECCDGVTFVSGGSVAIIVPPVGIASTELRLTGQQPSVNINNMTRTFEPASGSLVLTGNVPNLREAWRFTPGAGAMLFTGQAPNFRANAIITPGVGSVLLTGVAPTIVTALPPMTWSTTDIFNPITIDNGNLDASETTVDRVGVRATRAMTNTKVYLEFDIINMTNSGTDVYVGASTAIAPLDDNGAGGGHKLAWRGSGAIKNLDNGSNTAYLQGETIQMAIDLPNAKAWLAHATNAWIGGGDPAAGTLQTCTFAFATLFACYVSDNITTTLQKVRLLANASNQHNAAPSGFTAAGDI